MTLETWIAFALMNVAYSVTPGPNAAILVSSSARSGLRGGLAALGSIITAEVAWTGLAMLVVAGVLDIDQLMPGLLNTLGGIALVLLGASMLGARMQWRRSSKVLPKTAPSGAKAALIIGMTNPLSMIFFISVAPNFLSAEAVTPMGALAFVSAAVVSGLVGYAPYLGATQFMTPKLTTLIERGCGAWLFGMGALRLIDLFV